MWENETVVLVTSLKKRILGNEDRVRYSRISSDDAIPSFIKSVFAERVNQYIADENPISIQVTRHFDLQSEEIDPIREQLLDVMREASSFNEKEVEELLREALVLRLSYLIKPFDTMRRLVFEKGNEISIDQIEERIRGFKKILSYADRLLEKCRKGAKGKLTKEGYNRLITSLHHELFLEDPVQKVLNDFAVLTDFLSETKGEEVSRVEGSMMQNFLADRDLWGFRQAIGVEIKLGRDDFDAAGLEVTLKRYLELKDEFSRPETVGDREQESDVTTDKKGGEEQGRGQEVEDTGTPISLEESILKNGWELDFNKSDEEEPEQEKDAIEPAVSVEEKKEEKEKAEAMEETIRPEPDKAEPVFKETESDDWDSSTDVVTQSIRDLIDEKMGKVFVKKLFDGEKEPYEDLLDRLEEAESWRVAKILIDNELFKRDVDPFSREAIKLVDLVYGQFYPEEGAGGKQ